MSSNKTVDSSDLVQKDEYIELFEVPPVDGQRRTRDKKNCGMIIKSKMLPSPLISLHSQVRKEKMRKQRVMQNRKQ